MTLLMFGAVLYRMLVYICCEIILFFFNATPFVRNCKLCPIISSALPADTNKNITECDMWNAGLEENRRPDRKRFANSGYTTAGNIHVDTHFNIHQPRQFELLAASDRSWACANTEGPNHCRHCWFISANIHLAVIISYQLDDVHQKNGGTMCCNLFFFFNLFSGSSPSPERLGWIWPPARQTTNHIKVCYYLSRIELTHQRTQHSVKSQSKVRPLTCWLKCCIETLGSYKSIRDETNVHIPLFRPVYVSAGAQTS